MLASATIEEGSEGSRPSVQIGDPFAEKLLIEASLELVDEDRLEGLQDLGGAGLTCAASESSIGSSAPRSPSSPPAATSSLLRTGTHSGPRCRRRGPWTWTRTTTAC